ncbi:MAG: isochorismatase family protein [Acidimicrobiia bacterium]
MPHYALSGDQALVIVDCQNDFADPNGSLYVKGGEEVAVAVNELVIDADTAGIPVFYTQDWHPDSTPHFAKDGGIWPVHCVMGTWGAEIHPALGVVGPVVRKGANGEDGYSGFTMRDPETGVEQPTELLSMLTEVNRKELVVCGLALDYCVKATALDGLRLGWTVTVPLGLTAAVDLSPGDGERAIAELRQAGATVL